jgi:hypothetical protein
MNETPATVLVSVSRCGPDQHQFRNLGVTVTNPLVTQPAMILMFLEGNVSHVLAKEEILRCACILRQVYLVT